jgi:hypothetical protein
MRRPRLRSPREWCRDQLWRDPAQTRSSARAGLGRRTPGGSAFIPFDCTKWPCGVTVAFGFEDRTGIQWTISGDCSGAILRHFSCSAPPKPERTALEGNSHNRHGTRDGTRPRRTRLNGQGKMPAIPQHLHLGLSVRAAPDRLEGNRESPAPSCPPGGLVPRHFPTVPFSRIGFRLSSPPGRRFDCGCRLSYSNIGPIHGTVVATVKSQIPTSNSQSGRRAREEEVGASFHSEAFGVGVGVVERSRAAGAPAGAERGIGAPASDGDGGSGGATPPGPRMR